MRKGGLRGQMARSLGHQTTACVASLSHRSVMEPHSPHVHVGDSCTMMDIKSDRATLCSVGGAEDNQRLDCGQTQVKQQLHPSLLSLHRRGPAGWVLQRTRPELHGCVLPAEVNAPKQSCQPVWETGAAAAELLP